MCLTLCVNTNSRILYIELQFFSFLLISHTDTSLRGKLNRIVHKIGDYLVQSVTVTNNAAFRKMRIESFKTMPNLDTLLKIFQQLGLKLTISAA